MDLLELWLQFKEFFIGFVKYGLPTIAIMISILSYRDSRKANKIQDRLFELEEMLKKYELEEKEKEREKANMACIEARVINISKNKYKMKIWNSGKVTAYNVDFKVPEDCKGMVRREKVPYEFLDVGKSFEEHVIVCFGTPNKFKITTMWTDDQGIQYSKDQMVDIS